MAMHRGFEGLRTWSMKAAAEATAILTEQKQARREALRRVIEGSGTNYLKLVVYQDDGEGMQPKHVLLYLFTPGEAGERVAHTWLLEATFQHGGAIRASVYAACTGPLAGIPVIGAAMFEKGERQIQQVEAGTYTSERASSEEAA